MKSILIPTEFNRSDGLPFVEVKTDRHGNAVYERDKNNNPVLELPELVEVKTLPEVLKVFTKRMFKVAQLKKKELSIEDSSRSIDLIRAANVANGTIDLDNSVYEWLEKKIDEYGVDSFGIDAALIREAIRKITDVEPTRSEKRRDEKYKA